MSSEDRVRCKWGGTAQCCDLLIELRRQLYCTVNRSTSDVEWTKDLAKAQAGDPTVGYDGAVVRIHIGLSEKPSCLIINKEASRVPLNRCIAECGLVLQVR